MARRQQFIKQNMVDLPKCRRAADAPLGYFQAVFVYRIRQPENGLVLCGKHPISFNHASRADGALTFLCFVKEK